MIKGCHHKQTFKA